MALTISFLLAIPEFRDRCEVHNVENLIIDMGGNDKRKISCYPGSVAVPSPFILFFVLSFVLSPWLCAMGMYTPLL